MESYCIYCLLLSVPVIAAVEFPRYEKIRRKKFVWSEYRSSCISIVISLVFAGVFSYEIFWYEIDEMYERVIFLFIVLGFHSLMVGGVSTIQFFKLLIDLIRGVSQ